MNDQITEVAVQVGTQIISKSIAGIYSNISKYLTVKKTQYIETFSSYCEIVHEKSSLVRTLYSKNKPMHLEDVYVTTRFYQGGDNSPKMT